MAETDLVEVQLLERLSNPKIILVGSLVLLLGFLLDATRVGLVAVENI